MNKPFLRPLLDNEVIIYDQAFNDSLQNKLLFSFQYDVALAITRGIRGSLTEKLHQELGLK